MSLEEQLKQIQEAITAIEVGGQEYQIGTRRLKRADLSLLYQRAREIQDQINYENGQSSLVANTYVSVFDRR